MPTVSPMAAVPMAVVLMVPIWTVYEFVMSTRCVAKYSYRKHNNEVPAKPLCTRISDTSVVTW